MRIQNVIPLYATPATAGARAISTTCAPREGAPASTDETSLICRCLTRNMRLARRIGAGRCATTMRVIGIFAMRSAIASSVASSRFAVPSSSTRIARARRAPVPAALAAVGHPTASIPCRRCRLRRHHRPCALRALLERLILRLLREFRGLRGRLAAGICEPAGNNAMPVDDFPVPAWPWAITHDAMFESTSHGALRLAALQAGARWVSQPPAPDYGGSRPVMWKRSRYYRVPRAKWNDARFFPWGPCYTITPAATHLAGRCDHPRPLGRPPPGASAFGGLAS